MKEIDLVCTLGQQFGGNANPLYSGIGLRGHPGVDESCGFGTDLNSYVKQYIYDLYPIDKPASDGYTAIMGIVETPLEVFEWIEGHVSRIDVHVGQIVEKGQIIGAEGNHGPVYQGSTQITLAMQAAGDRRGSHRHLQKRPCIKVLQTRLGKTYLQSHGSNPYRDEQGYYYEIYDANNGYAGCVDPLAPLFPRDLFLGTVGYDVYLLQRALVLAGLFDPANCIGVFGPKTIAAVMKFQATVNIKPMLGYVGPLTRSLLNSLYTQV